MRLVLCLLALTSVSPFLLPPSPSPSSTSWSTESPSSNPEKPERRHHKSFKGLGTRGLLKLRAWENILILSGKTAHDVEDGTGFSRQQRKGLGIRAAKKLEAREKNKKKEAGTKEEGEEESDKGREVDVREMLTLTFAAPSASERKSDRVDRYLSELFLPAGTSEGATPKVSPRRRRCRK